MRGVQLPVLEPLVEGGVGGVQSGGEVPEPVELARPLAPPGLRVGLRLGVDVRGVDLRRGDEVGRGLEELLAQELLQAIFQQALVVVGLAHLEPPVYLP